MNTRNYKEAVAAVNVEIDKISFIADDIKAPEKLVEKIQELRELASSDTFKVLVIGKFSSGKSTMINALLGEPILPERATTATAIITEIRYGSTKRAVIFPKEGQWKGGNAPFEVPISELRNYLLINHNLGDSYSPDSNTVEGNVIASPFKKMEIYWPLDILKDGVEIVDSPGIDDPTCHGLVANEYLPQVHAIIYVMSGLNPYNNNDVNELEELRKRNFTTPIFVVTRYDNVIEDAENQYDPVQYIKEYREKVSFDLKHHTDLCKEEYCSKLGGDGVFYVSSRDAKKAKMSVPLNEELYVKSGYAKFEKYLSDYLVKCKGDEQMRAIIARFNDIADSCISMMQEQLRCADMPLEEFNAKTREVQGKLEYVKSESQLFVEQFNSELDAIITNDILPLTPQLLEGARNMIPEWKESYQCSVKSSFFHPKRTAENIATECQQHFENCYQNYQLTWVNENLVPLMEESIKKSAQRLEERSKMIDETLKEIKLTMNFITEDEANSSTTAAKITSVVYGLLTFDVFGAQAGFSSGFEGLVKGIITNILINLALITVIGTVSWPLIIAGEIINFLVVGKLNQNTMAKKITNKVAETYDDVLSRGTTLEDVRKQIRTAVETQFEDLKKAAADAAFADIELVEAEIQQIAEEKRLGEESIARHKEKLGERIKEVEELSDEVNTIQKSIA